MLLSISREYQLSVALVWALILREVVVLGVRAVKSPSHEALQKMRIHSIYFAVFLRTGCVGMVCIPILVKYSNVPKETLGTLFSGLLLMAFIPAVTGTWIMLRDWSVG